MAMKICPDCGEKYSDTYKRCPFCEEEAAMGRRGGGRQRGGHRVSQRDPGVLSPILIIAIIVLGLLLVYLLFGDSIGSKDKNPAQSGGASASVSAVEPDISGDSSGSASSSAEEPVTPDPVDPAGLPETLTMNKTDFTTKVGETPVKLTASGGSGSYLWYSEDDGIASVDENGNVVAVSAGTVNVYAYDTNGKGTCIVRVKGDGVPNTGSVGSGGEHKLNREDMTLSKGESFKLQLSGVTTAPVWSSSNTSVATVAGDGTVTAVGSGTATVTVSWDGASLSCIVRVK